MSKQQEALQFLDDLDSLNADTVAVSPPADPSNMDKTSSTGPATATTAEGRNEAETLAFLDEITQKSIAETQRTTTPLVAGRSLSSTPRTASRISLRKGVDGNVSLSRSGSPAPGRIEATSVPVAASTSGSGGPTSSSAAPAGSWGWSSVWSTASAAVKQARTVVDEQVKNLPVSIPNVPIPNNEQAKKWSEGMFEYVKNTQLDKLGHDLKSVGISTFTEILNVVAPPIAEHEVIEIWLSHDMRGYDGVESLVYECMTKVLEQVEGGDLVVNKGTESRPKDSNGRERELGGVDGYEAAAKLAQANIEDLIKAKPERQPRQTSATNPTTYSSVYLHIQPYITNGRLQFLIHLSSPSHNLDHVTVTQAVPHKWIISFESEGESKSNSWVEDTLVEVLRVGISVIGQEYLAERMGWLSLEKEKIEN
ncbi:hypothetical protein Clacol_003814 [Clathrus columnatus]|uniref:Maintenance of telomere capping protein 1 n=1 Tax=Clathrus columnatus TaxID=1419009 RepID=A0AAV5AAQ5_9AGAM|nr:hypothetical protein Clacol_003814 [Clathrus columnatus]